MIRILLLDTGKEWGGGTNSMIELLKRLDPQRFSVTALFYQDYAKGETSSLGVELKKIGVSLKLLTPRKQPLHIKLLKELVRGLFGFFPSLRSRALHGIERHWRIQPAARQIAQELNAGSYNLLYMNNQPSSNLEGYLAARMCNIPVVQHCRIEATMLPIECDIVNRTARHIICVSQGVYESLIHQGVRKELCSVVHNAIDGKQTLPLPVQLSGIKEDAIVFGSIGSLIERKANHHFLQAAALVKQRTNRRFHLLLLGSGPQRKMLEDLAEKLGIRDEVTFAGFQTQPLPWAARMDVLVLASAKEGLPRVVLEAMLLGKPVIATDIIGSRELVRSDETGFLYPYGDVALLSKHMERLLEEKDLRQAFGAAGKAIVLQDFSIEAYVAGVEKALEQAAS